ncbi:unnamed protein product [Discula destructiva]
MAETSQAPATPRQRVGALSVFSGGTAANFLVDVFDRIIAKRSYSLRYIIPISDNGGSSSELIRVFGGPSVGDVRSRLVRLIPNHNGDSERTALKQLFEHRLSADPPKARAEWLDIVEARHFLWTFISSQKKELIRSVLNTLNLEIVKRNRPTSVFNFAEASVGNLFLTGARLFSGSFESAIYLLSLICAIPESTTVLPAINSNFTHHISAKLTDGTELAGQVAISHPSEPTAVPDASYNINGDARQDPVEVEDANLPGSLSVLRGHFTFSKDDEEDLPARIERVWYINPYGHEIWPVPNPKVLDAIMESEAIVYSIGSLYTSIIPSLILRGVGAAIREVPKKVLILNSKVDRETGPASRPMTAVDYVRALTSAAKYSQTDFGEVSEDDMGRYVSHLVYLEEDSAGGVKGVLMPEVDVAALNRFGIQCVKVKGVVVGEGRKRMVRYEEVTLIEAFEGIIG